MTDALAGLLDGGYFRLYSGSQPATGDTPLGSQILLAELRFGTPAFAPAVGGVAAAEAITPEASAPASGTATWFRLLRSNGTTRVVDGSIDTSGADLNLSSTVVQLGAEVTIDPFSLTTPLS
jgi:hypothetical protein